MANRLDLDEQEQLDQLKHYWKQYGNLVTWVLILALGGFAAFNGWQLYQRSRATKAAVLFDQLDKSVKAGDLAMSERAFSDLKQRYGSTTLAEQGALALAELQYDKGKSDAARTTLTWIVDHGNSAEYPVIARLRLAGVLLDEKKYDEALKQLPADPPPAFVGLVADRRGDILLAQGKTAEARTAYRTAWDAMDPSLDYRNLVDAKLTALGASPTALPPIAAPAVEPAPAASSASAPTMAGAASPSIAASAVADATPASAAASAPASGVAK